MGYYTRYSGEITITPAISWQDVKLKGTQFLPENAERGRPEYRDVKFRILEETVEHPDGEMITRSAVALEPTWEDAYKGYDILEHVQELVDLFPGHEFSGYLECEGEESGDLWRLQIKGRLATKVVPAIVWPE